MRTLRIAFLMALVVACVVPAAAQASRYHGRAAGNTPSGGLAGRHVFFGGDDYAVQFRNSRGANTRYRVCAWMRGHRKGCQSARTGRRNHWNTVLASSIWNPDQLGRITYRWYVHGKRVAAWSVRFEAESE
jgi:hypothetical protein